MSTLLALDVAILLPPDVADHAVALSTALPQHDSGFVLGPDRLPHITLTQQFILREYLEQALERVAAAVRDHPPLRLHVSGGGRGRSSVWMAIRRSAPLDALHDRLMATLAGFEVAGGTAAAFVEEDGRLRDVAWVEGYRTQSSFERFTPHITLGHGETPPEIEPFDFEAWTIAACHLGRFCTCRRVLGSWTLI
jgi:2'-5' RNA ligase